jgi:hypothetical protein
VEGAVMTVTVEGAVWTVMVMTVIVEKTASMGRRRRRRRGSHSRSEESNIALLSLSSEGYFT